MEARKERGGQEIRFVDHLVARGLRRAESALDDAARRKLALWDSPNGRGRKRRGFSLVEATIGMAVLALAGSVIMLGMEASLHQAVEAQEQTIAAGMAKQIIDEVLGQRYMSPGSDPYQYPLSPNSYETGGNGRERFNDTDDYIGFRAQPAEDIWGVELGRGDGAGNLRNSNFRLDANRFARWRQEIDVYYVSATDPSQKLTGSQTSNFRCVEVRILFQDPSGSYRTLANVKRVYAYVPPPP
jgi:type II secretory pathway pseudopilin PulG